jgi:hypothetical protein
MYACVYAYYGIFGIVQKARGISVISIKYRLLSVIWVKWKVALEPRGKIIPSARLHLYRKGSV